MKRVLLITGFCCWGWLQVAAQTSAPPRILVLTERGGLHEGFVKAALSWLDSMSRKQDWQLRVINHPGEVEGEDLRNYPLFIQLNYPPYNWTAATKQAFENYIDRGWGSWIGFHHATLLGEFDGYPMWKWFSAFMGGIRFKNYIAEKATADVHVEAGRHPVMQGLPPVFSIPQDEWYTFDQNPRPRVRVLAIVDESSYQPASAIKMGDHPVIWVNEQKKARNVYFLMGHSAVLLSTPAFRKMFANAISWCLASSNQNGK